MLVGETGAQFKYHLAHLVNTAYINYRFDSDVQLYRKNQYIIIVYQATVHVGLKIFSHEMFVIFRSFTTIKLNFTDTRVK